MIYGGVAHLGERLNGIQEVVGSIPIVSTTTNKSEPLPVGDGFGFLLFQNSGKVQKAEIHFYFSALCSKKRRVQH
jgi:hypothetical protein